jgi:hypothetical protein
MGGKFSLSLFYFHSFIKKYYTLDIWLAYVATAAAGCHYCLSEKVYKARERERAAMMMMMRCEKC